MQEKRADKEAIHHGHWTDFLDFYPKGRPLCRFAQCYQVRNFMVVTEELKYKVRHVIKAT